MTIWMEVDLKNKELPTGRMATKSRELSRMLGLNPSAVCDAICKAKTEDLLPVVPCSECSCSRYCNKSCGKFELWFKKYWRGLRRKYLYGGN